MVNAVSENMHGKPPGFYLGFYGTKEGDLIGGTFIPLAGPEDTPDSFVLGTASTMAVVASLVEWDGTNLSPVDT